MPNATPNRLGRLLLALLLLATAWPAFALTVKTTADAAAHSGLVWMASHTPVTATVFAALLLLRTRTGGRLMTRLVGKSAARVISGGAAR